MGIIKESGIPGNTAKYYCHFEITRGKGWTLEGDDTIIFGALFCIEHVEDCAYRGWDE